MIDIATGTQMGTTLTVTGLSWNPPVLSPDGARAFVTATVADVSNTVTTTRVAVIDIATGAQRGTTLTLIGDGHATFSANGTRSLITAYDTAGAVTRVTVVDTATGAQVGTTATLTGQGSALLSSKDTRALITTYVTDAASTTT